MDLSDVSVKDLAAELLKRPGLLRQDGLIESALVHQLVEMLRPVFCTDGIPVRRIAGGELEAMAIVRNTGRDRGLLLPIGGALRRKPRAEVPESIEECLRRHVRTDLKLELEMLVPWEHPVRLGQFSPVPERYELPDCFSYEYVKHAVVAFYPIKLCGEPTEFGSTAHGGQEASGIRRFTLSTMPPPEAFGYNMWGYYKDVMLASEKLI